MSNIHLVKSNFIKSLSDIMSLNEIKSIWDNWVLNEILGISQIDIIINQINYVKKRDELKIEQLISHLLKNRPIQYFFGYSYFKDLKISIDSHVLIPRVETEELVDIVISKLTSKNLIGIDIGTGSGCIPILLKKKLDTVLYGVDFSQNAIRRAKINANKHNVSINFRLLDILNFDDFDLLPNFDFIVSNPPYVLKSEVLPSSNIHAEPKSAIFVPDDNPLIFYKAICQFAKKKLKHSGVMFFEINPILHKCLISLFREFNYKNIETRKDFFGKKRFIIVS